MALAEYKALHWSQISLNKCTWRVVKCRQEIISLYPILNLNQFLHCLVSLLLVQSVNGLWAWDANKFWIVKDVKSFNKSLAPWISTIVWRCQGMRYFEREKYLTVRGIVRRHNILISALCTPVVNAVDAVVVAQDDKEWTGKLWCCDDVVSESDMMSGVPVMAHDPDPDHSPCCRTVHYNNS